MNPNQNINSNIAGRKILTPKRRLNRSNSNSSAGSTSSLGSWTNVSATDGSLAGFGSAGTNNANSPAVASPSFSFNSSPNPSVPTSSFGQPSESASSPAQSGFTFGSFSSPALNKSNNSLGTTTSTSMPTFNFGQTATSSSSSNNTPNLNFGSTSSSTTDASKPAFSFGQATSSGSTASSMPSFTFGQTAPSTSTSASKPTFSFSAPSSSTSDAASTKPLFTFGSASASSQNKDDVTTTSSSSGALTTSSSSTTEATGSKPAFSFNFPAVASAGTSNTANTTSKPAFSFGGSTTSNTSTTSGKPAFTFGSASAESTQESLVAKMNSAADKSEDITASTANSNGGTSSEKTTDGKDTRAPATTEIATTKKPFQGFTFGNPSSSATSESPQNDRAGEKENSNDKESDSLVTTQPADTAKSDASTPETDSRKRPFTFSFGDNQTQPHKKQDSTTSLFLSPAPVSNKLEKRGRETSDDDDTEHDAQQRSRFKKRLGTGDSSANKYTFSFGEPNSAIDSASLSTKPLLHGNSPLRTSTVSIQFEEEDGDETTSKEANNTEHLVFAESDENEGSDKDDGDGKADKASSNEKQLKPASTVATSSDAPKVFSFATTASASNANSKASSSSIKEPLFSTVPSITTSQAPKSAFTLPKATSDKGTIDLTKATDEPKGNAQKTSSKLFAPLSVESKDVSQGSVKLAFSKVDDSSKPAATTSTLWGASTKEPEPLSLIPPAKSITVSSSETTLKTTIIQPSEILHSTKTYELPVDALHELGEVADFISTRAKKRDRIQSELDSPLPNLLTEIANEARALSDDSDTLALRLNDVDGYINEMKYRIKRKFTQMYRSAQILKGEQIVMPSDDNHFEEETRELAKTAQDLAKMIDEIHETLTSLQQTSNDNYTPEQIGSILNKQSQALLSLAGTVNEIHTAVQQTNSLLN